MFSWLVMFHGLHLLELTDWRSTSVVTRSKMESILLFLPRTSRGETYPRYALAVAGTADPVDRRKGSLTDTFRRILGSSVSSSLSMRRGVRLDLIECSRIGADGLETAPSARGGRETVGQLPRLGTQLFVRRV